MPTICQSENNRTSEPSSNSRRQAQPLVDVMPKPATAAAIAPSFSLVEKRGWICIFSSLPSRSNVHAVGTAAALPPTFDVGRDRWASLAHRAVRDNREMPPQPEESSQSASL